MTKKIDNKKAVIKKTKILLERIESTRTHQYSHANLAIKYFWSEWISDHQTTISLAAVTESYLLPWKYFFRQQLGQNGLGMLPCPFGVPNIDWPTISDLAKDFQTIDVLDADGIKCNRCWGVSGNLFVFTFLINSRDHPHPYLWHPYCHHQVFSWGRSGPIS